MEKIKQLHKTNEAEFISFVETRFDVSLSTEWETTRIEDHFEDAETVQYVRDQADSGNEWAWCTAKVTVTIGGLTATDYLGGCSYESESDFKAGGYYSDMLLECLIELHEGANKIIKAFEA